MSDTYTIEELTEDTVEGWLASKEFDDLRTKVTDMTNEWLETVPEYAELKKLQVKGKKMDEELYEKYGEPTVEEMEAVIEKIAAEHNPDGKFDEYLSNFDEVLKRYKAVQEKQDAAKIVVPPAVK